MFGKEKNPNFSGAPPTYVGKGMRIEGKIWGMRPIWIDGEVKGAIDISSEVIIGEPAKVDAIIRAATIKINGFVEGELFASKKIEIMAKGRFHGKITNLAGCLIIHDGGIVEGQCSTVTEEKMKSLLPQKLPKLLPETNDSVIKKINAPESVTNSLSQPEKDPSLKSNN